MSTSSSKDKDIVRISLDRKLHTVPSYRKEEDDFSVVTYNILADSNIMDTWYPYTPKDHISSSQRHGTLMKELEVLNGDIICLQEVEESYFPLLEQDLKTRGYAGAYHVKTMGAKEGLATFYRENSFKLLDVKKYKFNDDLAEALKMKGISKDFGRPFERNHVFLVTKLKHLQTGNKFRVGNIHTIWDNFTQLEVSSLQLTLALRKLKEDKDDDEEENPLIMAGDFNSEPHMPPYLIIKDGKPSDEVKKKLLTFESKNGKGVLFNALEEYYSHSIDDLRSSYLSIMGKEPELTNYANFDLKHYADWCLDYIWFTEDSLKVTSVLDTVGIPENLLPDSVFPSDHLSLKSTFSFRNK